MKVTKVRIDLSQEVESPVRAYVQVILEDSFIVYGLRILEKKDKSGCYLAMPSRKNKAGKFVETAHPLTAEMRTELETAVFEEFEIAKAAVIA